MGKKKKQQNAKKKSAGNHSYINRKYKDSLFRMLFSDREALLSLYNAVNQTAYKDPSALEIMTIDDAIYVGIKNDLAFLIDCRLNLYEAQSTRNPNMPLRGVFYFSQVYQGYVNRNGLNIFSEKQIRLPVPRYLVLYNGTKEEPDRQILRLSDAFDHPEEACLECTAVMLNINAGHNSRIMKQCRTLYEYAVLVDTVRNYLNIRGIPREQAVDEAVRECIRRGILVDFLKKHRAEVKNVILTEYDREAHIRAEKKESWEDGVAEGRKYGMAEERESLLRSAIRVQRGKGQKEEDIIAFLAECFELPEAQARECYQRIAQEEML